MNVFTVSARLALQVYKMYQSPTAYGGLFSISLFTDFACLLNTYDTYNTIYLFKIQQRFRNISQY